MLERLNCLFLLTKNALNWLQFIWCTTRLSVFKTSANFDNTSQSHHTKKQISSKEQKPQKSICIRYHIRWTNWPRMTAATGFDVLPTDTYWIENKALHGWCQTKNARHALTYILPSFACSLCVYVCVCVRPIIMLKMVIIRCCFVVEISAGARFSACSPTYVPTYNMCMSGT